MGPAWLALLLAAGGAAPPTPAPATTPAATPAPRAARPAAMAQALERLRGEFAAFLQDPAAYGRRAGQEAASFPEGRIYPYLLPALGFLNLALAAGEADRPPLLAQADRLLELALPEARRQLNGDLLQLADYREQGTWLGLLDLALGLRRLAGAGERHAALNDHLTGLLAEALRAAGGRPLASYPGQTWTFDTITVLAALDVHDRLRSAGAAAPLIAAHLDWVARRGCDPATGLPRSREEAGAPPRGCDLSWRIALLAQFAPAAARTLWTGYLRHFWRDAGFLAGFAEWPAGRDGGMDVDSGPIFLGLGLTASGLGCGAALALGDEPRLNRLAASLAAGQALLAGIAAGNDPALAQVRDWFAAGGLPLDATYLTGFLYGDAALFMSLSWTPWPARPAPAAPPAPTPVPAAPAAPAP